MSIDFFKGDCRETTNSAVFGLCDDEDIYPAETPAYIDEEDPSKWIAQVNNLRQVEVTFTAVDHCIEGIVRANGDKDNQCDAMLAFEDSVMFVELKTGSAGGWVTKGKLQLATTIGHFHANNNLAPHISKLAHIANSARPLFAKSYLSIIQEFKDDTDYILNIDRQIHI